MAKANGKLLLKFAVMCNSSNLQQWQKQVIDNLLASSVAEPVLLLIPKKIEQESRPSFLKKAIKYPWRKVFFRKYYQYFFHPQAFRMTYTDFGNPDLPVLHCSISKRARYSEYFNEADIEIIKSYQPDFILKFGFGIIRGDILTCTPYGVWSFHHGDEMKYRGIPPAFHEIYQGDCVTASILQRLTDTLDGGVILRKGFFPTINHSWQANLDQAIALSTGWPADVCREIAENKALAPVYPASNTNAPIYKEPGNTVMMIFLFKQWFNKVKFHLQNLFLAEKWSTVLVKAQVQDVLKSPQTLMDCETLFRLDAKSNNRYFADGFAMMENDRLLLLFEDYSYKNQKAVISACWFDPKQPKPGEIHTVLEEPWHLSYPFLFKDNGSIYCIPESKDHGATELYRFDSTAMKLRHIRTLLPDLKVADATLFYHHSRWYLFFTPEHATNTELHIWHTESLDAPFIPHLLNPVKADIRNARPAGQLFIHDGKLYRPAQDCSKTYGGSIIINEITALSEKTFSEKPVGRINPPKGYKGVHTLSFAGDYTYFDCKKHLFSSASFKYQLLRKLGNKSKVSPAVISR